jgi:hypothetical protein
MPVIRFSHDWNKKVTGSNELFTTVRGHTPEKWIYYCDRLGKIFTVMLGKKKMCEAELILVQGDILGEIPLPFLMIDTGLTNQEEIFKLFKKFGVEERGEVIILAFLKK